MGPSKDVARKLWGMRHRVFRSTVETKRRGPTPEELVANLEAMARQAQEEDGLPRVEIIPSLQVAKRTASLIAESLEMATRPVLGSAEELQVICTSGPETIEVDHSVRHALLRPFGNVEEIEASSEFWLADVEFARINTDTGFGIMRFLAPRGAEEVGNKMCRIKDPILNRPLDPYTGAQHSRSAMSVLVRKSYYDRKANAFRYEVTRPEVFQDQPELFS